MSLEEKIPIEENDFITSKWCEYSLDLTPKYEVRRFDDKAGQRFYWFEKESEIIPAAGITTWLGRVMPESPQLTDWKMKYKEDWPIVLNLTADYGTLLHACCGEMMIYNRHPEDVLIHAAKEVLRKLRKYDKTVKEDLIDRNIISFQKFREDYNLKPLLIEALLVARAKTGEYYCLTQDLLAEVTYMKKDKREVQDGHYVRGEKKGQPKFVTVTDEKEITEVVCIDFKSNWSNKDTKSFFDSHKYQLMGTKKAVRQNFGINVDRIFNWAPLSWKKETGDYVLKEWKTTDADEKVFELYETLASELGHFKPRGTVEIFEKFEMGRLAKDMVRRYGHVEYVQYLREKANQV